MICYLIDDDEDDRDFFAMALEEVDRSIPLRTAENDDEALRILAGSEWVPDIIFLDINMPRIDGWQCLRPIREFDNLAEVSVVIYSTSDWGYQVRAYPEFSGFLTKQLKISDLAGKLREVFLTMNL